MKSEPKVLTIINKILSKRRTIHLSTSRKKKPYKSIAHLSNVWVKKIGLPVVIVVTYSKSYDRGRPHAIETNSMTCRTESDLYYALQAFVKEYMEEN